MSRISNEQRPGSWRRRHGGTQSGTLASVPPFPEQWQAPPYQPGADGGTQPGDLRKAEREALEKSSVAYKRFKIFAGEILGADGWIGNSARVHRRLRGRDKILCKVFCLPETT